MQAFINKHQLNQIVDFISQEYEIFASIKKDGKVVWGQVNKNTLSIPVKKSPMPFKEIIWPNNNHGLESAKDRKIAFLGLPNCDVIALKIFLKEFSHTNLLPDRKNILVFSAECESDEFCFCTTFKQNKERGFDLHIQKEKDGFSIFSGSEKGRQILRENAIKPSILKTKLKKISLSNIESLKAETLLSAIDNYSLHQKFWQKIANNCFGCGSCTAVCPLCFCVKQEEKNVVDGSGKTCLLWDSCLSKSFSEIQNHQDMRPQRVNRLYNWYHHKFVRAFVKQKHFLCSGCGRCIQACPAHLNQYKIISSLEKQEEEIHE